jgi:hypothetical protein
MLVNDNNPNGDEPLRESKATFNHTSATGLLSTTGSLLHLKNYAGHHFTGSCKGNCYLMRNETATPEKNGRKKEKNMITSFDW